MKIRRANRFLAVFLALALMLGLFPATLAAGEGEGEASKLKVTIVSAADGRSTGLRDSELLTVKVEGYDGDLSQLQVHWRNSTTGRMCIYDSPDLSVANYQESVSGNQNPGGTGWWYASVNFPKGAAKRGGWITVNILDDTGKPLGSVKGENEGYYGVRRDGSGTAFAPPSLTDDLSQGTAGMFEGEKLPLSTLLGRMGITHAICSDCTYENVSIRGTVGAEATPMDGGDYLITATHPGEHRLMFTMKKSDKCAFHPGQTVQGVVLLQVFPKAQVTTTGTSVTLDLTDMEDQYTFTLGEQSYTLTGSEDVTSGRVTFDHLEPNTAYTITVSVPTSDGSKEIKAYIHAVTEPLYKLAFYTYLDNWELDLIENLTGVGAEGLYVRNRRNGLVTRMEQAGEYGGYYETYVEEGDYDVFMDAACTKPIEKKPITVPNRGAQGDAIQFLSVKTVVDTAEEVHSYRPGTHIDAPARPENIPEGKLFAGWECTAGPAELLHKIFQPDSHLTYNLSEPLVLTAVLKTAFTVTADVTIDHTASDTTTTNPDPDNSATLYLWEEDAGNHQLVEAKEVTAAGSFTFDPVPAPEGGVSYAVTAQKSSYESRVTDDGVVGNTQNFQVALQYDPNSFNLDFSLIVGENARHYLSAVNMKVTYFDPTDSTTGVIQQHTTGGVWMDLTKADENGVVTGSYPVWKTKDDGTPYHYGLQVVGYRLKDGTAMAVGGSNEPFNEANALATADSAYWDADNDVQSGTLQARVSLFPHKITFEMGEGGDAPLPEHLDSQDWNNVLIMPPEITPINVKPGYVFLGWEEKDGASIPTTGDWLTQNLTLVAQWAPPRTITVNVTADHTLTAGEAPYDGTKLQKCTVVLQRFAGNDWQGNETWATETWQNVPLTFNGDHTSGAGNCTFTVPNVQEDGMTEHRYRVQVIARNYTATLTPANGEVPASDTVEISLKLNPNRFTLSYEVDASEIGADFRDDLDINVYVGYSITGGPPWTVVSQHKDGEAVLFDNGDEPATGSLDDAWQVHTSGKSTRYQMALNKQGDTLSAKEKADQNFRVEYGAPGYYDAAADGGDTLAHATLNLKLIPKSHTVTFIPGAAGVTGLDSYLKDDEVTYSMERTWSQESDPLPTPSREHYIFQNWSDGTKTYAAGEKIDPAVEEDLILTATWTVDPADPPPAPPRPSDPTTSTTHVSSKLETGDHGAYIVGYPDGTVQPQANITRAEVAMIFYRLLTPEYRRQVWTMENPYPDVAETDWYGCAAATLTKAGIFKGLPDGTFGGDKPISRAELAAVAVRFLDQKPDGTGKFADISGTWAEGEISQTATLGWFNGYPDGLFHPERLITRAEAVTMINRMLGRDKFTTSPFLDGMKTFPDNTVGQWHYEAIQEAANGHSYKQNSCGEECWEALENQ